MSGRDPSAASAPWVVRWAAARESASEDTVSTKNMRLKSVAGGRIW